MLSPAAASFDMFEDYAARGRAFIDAVGGSRGRPQGTRRPMETRTTPCRSPPSASPARDRTATNTLQRERHEPEYGILVATVALAAIGILMVYSSSAIKSFLQRDDPFAIVGPQILWASLGIVAMLVMMRVDYRWLRVASVPMFLVGVAGLLLVFIDAINIEVGGSARWLKIGPLPAVHPAEFMKLALVVYLAHWFAKRGSAVRGLLGGTLPFLVIAVPGDRARAPRARPRHVVGARVHRVHDVLPRGREPPPPRRAWRLAAVPTVALMFLRGYQMDRITAWLDPWADAVGLGFHSVQGYLALALGGVLGAGLGESRLAGGLFLPNAFNDFIFAIVGEEFGLLGGRARDRPVPRLRLPRDPDQPRGAGHVRRAARGRASRPGSASRRSSTSGSWSGSSRSRASRCRSSRRAGRA